MIQKLIKCTFPTSLYHTANAHGWSQLAPWCWDSSRNELSRPERLGSGKQVLVKVTSAEARTFMICIGAERLEETDYDVVESNVKRWLSVDWDPNPAIRIAAPLDGHIALFIKQGGGRFLRSSTFYEDFVKTLCTINANWAFTRRMISSLVDLLGNGVFPTPLTIIDSGEGVLRQYLRLGFRARHVVELSRQLLDQGWIDDLGNLVHLKLTFEDLVGLRGIGVYSASHLMMLSQDFRRIPIDSEVSRYCRQQYDIEPEGIESFFDNWGDYKFLGYKVRRTLDGGD